jgi:multidrug resistance protein, MATE family
LHRFFRLAIVNILSNLMVPLAGLIDVAFLGHLSEIRHLAGVALAMVLFNYLYWTFGFLRMGTTGLTAQATGRQNFDEVLLVGLRNGAIALGIGLGIVLLQVPLRMAGFAFLSAAPEVKIAGESFYNALIWGAPATLLNYVLIGWYLGRSQGGKVLLLSAVANLSNVGLDYLFIVHLGWESAGSGTATALSQIMMAGVGLSLASREIKVTQLKQVGRQIFNTEALKASVALNGELVVRTFALISTFAAFTNISSILGTAVLSSNTVLLQVIALASYFIDGLAFAMESLVGSLSVQGKIERLKQLLWVGGSSSLMFGLVFSFAFMVAPLTFFKLLTNHPEILDRIRDYTPWLLPVLGFGSVAYFLDGYFIGLTAGRLLRSSVVAAATLGFIPMAIAAWYFRSVHLLWLALTLFMVIRAVTLGIQVPKTLQQTWHSTDRSKG